VSSLAAFVSPGRGPLTSTAHRAGVAETLGYDLVLTNHVANRDGLVTLAAYGQTTSRVRLGTGVYPAFIRSPVALAQAAVTLDELLEGRLVLGLGTSHRSVMEASHGISFPAEPLVAMREHVSALRDLFRTGSVDVDGSYVTARFAFRGVAPRPDLPIHLAALSPGMLRLAGEIADGVILWLCEPTYIRETVVPCVVEGAERAGRDPAEIEIVAAVTCAVTHEPEGALTTFRRTLLPYLSLPFYRRMLERAGFAEDIERFDSGADGGREAAVAAISEEMARTLAAIGTAGEVRGVLDRYRDAGVTLPSVGPLTADGTLGFEATLAAAIGRDLDGPT
jgi:alkanesulfonate monooxygenase SsuD/methylene tetrahydromethanopterin reductase-like flavin-dependent oxidoreductase (luciferase family)